MEIQSVTTVDGSRGEGGGQIFRTSLSLAMCCGRPVRIMNIRAGRNKPGLLRQHLTCLRAAQEICGAEVKGDQLGATEVSFAPGPIKAGEYSFAIGSAGSTTLVFQTLLPALLLADDVSLLTLEGGTHNGMAPSFDFIEQCFVPLIAKMGYTVEVEFNRFGFFPVGGGLWRARIYPAATPSRLELNAPGLLLEQAAVATSSRLPAHVTERELERVRRKCQWPARSLQQRLVESFGPGNIMSLQLRMEHVTEMFEVVGERGLSAEQVAGRAIREMTAYRNSGAAVGEHLADQLLLPMAVGRGGCFTTFVASSHLLTNIDVIQMLSGCTIRLKKVRNDLYEIIVSSDK